MPYNKKQRKHLFAIIGCLILYAGVVIGYAFLSSQKAEEAIMNNIDRRLMAAAQSLKYMLPPDFHDRALDADSISMEEEMKNRATVSQFAHETDFEYLYTLVEKDGKFYFSAPTVTQEEAEERERWYFYPYEEPPEEFYEAYKTRKPRYATYADEWGHFRSVAFPQYSPGGRLYLSCADFDISFVKGMLLKEKLRTAEASLIFLLFTIPIILIYRSSFRLHNRELMAVNQQLVDYQQHLEQLVEERTADLKEAKETAEEANRLKTRFVFNVSHEMRTPLNGIVGFCEALLDAQSVNVAHHHARIILQESEVLLHLINDLLDHAKLEAGKVELDVDRMDLKQLLDNASSCLVRLIRNKNLEYKVEIDPQVPAYVMGDFLRLRQIILNLASNAIKFTEKGSVAVAVTLLGRRRNQCQIRFSVKDTGIGIPKDKQKAIFESFTQADVSTTRRYGGTGLGTSIANQLAGLMGSHIQLESEEGQGSHFWFDVWLEETGAPAQPEPTYGWAPALEPGAPQLVGRILVAEDYPTNQTIARMFLEGAGHRVFIAQDGKDAVELADQEKFDLILMDLQMPKMDGSQAAKQIRSASKLNASVPIVAMTASAEASTRQACLQEGFDDIVTKPIHRDQLVAKVAQWLNGTAESGQEGSGQDVFSLSPAQRQADSLPPIDIDLALQEFGNRDTLQTVCERFVQQIAQQMAVIDQAWANHDYMGMLGEAHKIRGGASTLEAVPLALAAGQLEGALKAEQLDQIEGAIAFLKKRAQELTQYQESYFLN